MSALSGLVARVLGLAGPRRLPPPGNPATGRSRQQTPMPRSRTRWELAAVEDAIHAADTGQLYAAAQICAAIRRDGMASGVLSTRTEGLLQLPVRWKGDEEICASLAAEWGALVPFAELALLAGDGLLLGVGVGEMVLEEGTELPTFRRLDPAWLQYVPSEDAWYYRTIAGRELIVPGDGRWVLHMPGGHAQPWASGHWMALGRAYITKERAFYSREAFAGGLANPALVASSPTGAGKKQREGFLADLMNYGVNSIFDLPSGWQLDIVESNGRGYEVFQDTINTSDLETQVILAGQKVSTGDAPAFSSAKIFQTIRYDLIQATGDALARTLNEQVIPQWVNRRFGGGFIAQSPSVYWDVTPPSDLIATATLLTQFGAAVRAANEAMAPYGRVVDAVALARSFGFALLPDDAASKAVVAAVVAAAAKPANTNAAPAAKEAA